MAGETILVTGRVLPSGTVTFLFTDIERSTETVAALGDERFARLLTSHHDLLRRAFDEHHGVEIGTAGDAFFVVFERASDAIDAAVEGQRSLEAFAWPDGARLRVRMGLHTGEALVRDGDYVGFEVHRAKRISDIGHGGQVLLSEATANVVSGLQLLDLGRHRLKDVSDPQRIWQIDDPSLQREFPALRSLGAQRHHLPAERSTFVGREEEVRTVADSLEQARLLTLTGVGGCGKTRLALRVATEAAASFADGVVFVELAPVGDSSGVPGAVAGALGAPVRGTGRSAITELAATINTSDLLLVLDNCEHVIDSCAELADVVLATCPNLHILATSREGLDVPGEQIIAVPPLAVDDAHLSDAVLLFCERAAAVRAGFTVSAENAEDILAICRRLDGVPLAIEFAAAMVASLSPAQIAERLDERFAFLTGGRRRVQRQQTLAASLDWSYELLDDDEKAFLRRSAVFRGGFTLDAAEDICGDGLSHPFGLIAALVAKSLIESDGANEPRYRLLETVRLYAEGKLVAANEAQVTRDRHRDFFLRWVESIPEEESNLHFGASSLVEQHNLRAALDWSEHEGRTDLVARIASCMGPVWDYFGLADGIRWLSLGLTAVDDLGRDEAVRVLWARADVAAMALETDADSTQWLERAAELAGDSPAYRASIVHASLCNSYAVAAWSGQDVKDAVEFHGRRSMELATNDAARLFAWWFLGHARIPYDPEGAIEAYERARTLAHEVVGAAAIAGYIEAMLSFQYHAISDFVPARERAEQAYAARDQAGPWAVYNCLPLPLAIAQGGDDVGAMELLDDIIERDRMTAAVPGTMACTVAVLGCLAGLRGDWSTATVLLACARAAFERGEARSSAEVALYVKYAFASLEFVGDDADRLSAEGASMSLRDAIDYGRRSNDDVHTL